MSRILKAAQAEEYVDPLNGRTYRKFPAVTMTREEVEAFYQRQAAQAREHAEKLAKLAEEAREAQSLAWPDPETYPVDDEDLRKYQALGIADAEAARPMAIRWRSDDTWLGGCEDAAHYRIYREAYEKRMARMYRKHKAECGQEPAGKRKDGK